MGSVEVQFVKMTGAGNDFVLVDNRMRSYDLDWSTLAPSLCDRRYGIGADGLLVLLPEEESDFHMEYYNADGSYGGMCGNGGRCAALYAMLTGSPSVLTFSAVHHMYKAKRLENGTISLQMKDVSSPKLGVRLDIPGHQLIAHVVDTGTAHVVLWYEDLPAPLREEIDSKGIDRIGKAVRFHEHFAPGGTNVNVVRAAGEGMISMRTYERGVEEETLACGTGAVAAAIIAHALKNYPQSIGVITRSNERLSVSFKSNAGQYSSVHLTGPAKILFHGKVSLDDLRAARTSAAAGL